MKTVKSITTTTVVSRIVMGLVIAGIFVRTSAAESQMAICLEKGIDPLVLSRAHTIADQMFSQVDLRIRWYGYQGSCPVRGDKPILIRISSHTSKSTLPGAFASALPFEGSHIQVFYDRVRATVDDVMVPYLLGYVLVHEITHIIEGSDRHSDSGIMKARWGTDDYQRMTLSALGFTEQDLRLIRIGLAARASAKHAGSTLKLESGPPARSHRFSTARSDLSSKESEEKIARPAFFNAFAPWGAWSS